MNVALLTRTHATAGRIADLTEVEATAVVYLRIWYCGSAGKAKIHQNLSLGLGRRVARDAVSSFEKLCFFAVQHGRCQFLPGALGCQCLNAGEAVFANLIANASFGQRDAAVETATLLVDPDVAETVAKLAEDCGAAFRQVSQRAQTNWQARGHPANRPH